MNLSRSLQYFGVVALACLVLGSAIALSVVKDRIQVVVSAPEDPSERGPDPLELLRADLTELRAEIARGDELLPQHLQTVHDSLASADSERDTTLRAELAQLRTQLTALEARLDTSTRSSEAARTQTQESLQRFAAALNELSGAIAAQAQQAAELARARVDVVPIDVVPVAVVPVAVTPVEVTPIETAPVAVAPTLAVEPVPANEPAPAAKAEPAKKGFLSFKVPEKGFRFDVRQKLSIVASLSRVGFDAKSTLHDFTGVTQKVEGELVVDLARPGDAPKGRIAIDASSLDTGLADRDEGMRELLESAQQKQISFAWSTFEPQSVDTEKQLVVGTARGKLTIRGVERDLAMPVKVSIDASKRVGIEGEAKIKLTDFGIEPPSQLGMISVEDELRIWISLRARTLGPVEETK